MKGPMIAPRQIALASSKFAGISRRKIFSAGLSLAVAACGLRAARAEQPIRFGLTPVFLSNDLELLDRLSAYLSRTCQAPVQLVTRRTYQEITALLVSGQLDAAWICGFPFVVFRKELDLIAVPVWNGRPEYQSYLIGKKGRSYAGLPDLKGDVHAFSDPNSNSGYLVTVAALAELKQEPGAFFKRTFFTYGHRNVIRAVASGLAQSGSVDGYVFDVVSSLEPDLTKDLLVMRRSEWLGFPPIAAPAREPVAGRTALLRKAFEVMDQSADGRAVLSLLKLDCFRRESDSLFAGIKQKVALVGSGAAL